MANRRLQFLGHHIGLCDCPDMSQGLHQGKCLFLGAFTASSIKKIFREELTSRAGFRFRQQESGVLSPGLSAPNSVHGPVVKALV